MLRINPLAGPFASHRKHSPTTEPRNRITDKSVAPPPATWENRAMRAWAFPVLMRAYWMLLFSGLFAGVAIWAWSNDNKFVFSIAAASCAGFGVFAFLAYCVHLVGKVRWFRDQH
jgi:hypothetical protein